MLVLNYIWQLIALGLPIRIWLDPHFLNFFRILFQPRFNEKLGIFSHFFFSRVTGTDPDPIFCLFESGSNLPSKKIECFFFINFINLNLNLSVKHKKTLNKIKQKQIR